MVGPVVAAALPSPAAQLHLGREVTAALAQQMVYIMLAAVVAVRGLLAAQGQLMPRMVGLAVLVCNLALLGQLYIMLAVVAAELIKLEGLLLTQRVVLAEAGLVGLLERVARGQLTQAAVVVVAQFT